MNCRRTKIQKSFAGRAVIFFGINNGTTKPAELLSTINPAKYEKNANR